MDDTESSICCGCAAPFTLLRRRHHCRRCGRLFCAECSALRSPLPPEEIALGTPPPQGGPSTVVLGSDAGNTSWRVCTSCHQAVELTPLAVWGTAPSAPRALSVSETLASLRALSARELDAMDDPNEVGDSNDAQVRGSLAQRWILHDGSTYHNGEIVPTGVAELTDLGWDASSVGGSGAGHAADISDADEVQQQLRARYRHVHTNTSFPLSGRACVYQSAI